MEREEITLHGHTVSYRRAGWGPLIVLIHGITGSSDTWLDVIEPLAEKYTVVAPDLLGHGESAKPRGDYSLGAYASGIRDLLGALGHDRGTIVGHSLGGGVAMQMAYQFPERCERLVLVSSGGLGREVSPFLRAAVLPGSELVLPAARVVSRPERDQRRGLVPRPPRHARRSRRGRDLARLLVAQRRRRARRVHPHAARDRRPRRPARERNRSPLPRPARPHDAALGRARPDHPGRPWPRGARAHPWQPLRVVPRRRSLPAPHRPARVRRSSWTTSSPPPSPPR